jgi:5,10-methylene-tetrahydrofolate dehydrogenase/methenyl tetrahydrofolate cyclohydrolase
MADIISGTEMRAAILDELRQEVEAIREKHGTVPGLDHFGRRKSGFDQLCDLEGEDRVVARFS